MPWISSSASAGVFGALAAASAPAPMIRTLRRVRAATAISACLDTRASSGMAFVLSLAHRPGGEPASTSPDHALARPRLGGALGIPPPDRRERRGGIFGKLVGTAEAVPARSPLVGIGPLR